MEREFDRVGLGALRGRPRPQGRKARAAAATRAGTRPRAGALSGRPQHHRARRRRRVDARAQAARAFASPAVNVARAQTATSLSRIQSASNGSERRDGPPWPLPGKVTTSTGPLTRCCRIDGFGRRHGLVVGRAHRQDREIHAVRDAFERELLPHQARPLVQRRRAQEAAHLQPMRHQGRQAERLVEEIGEVERRGMRHHGPKPLVQSGRVDRQHAAGRPPVDADTLAVDPAVALQPVGHRAQRPIVVLDAQRPAGARAEFALSGPIEPEPQLILVLRLFH